MNDLTLERTIDRAVQHRLTTDRAYLNASDSEEQAEREHVIELEEEFRIVREARRRLEDDDERAPELERRASELALELEPRD